jgi:hypothetical protein
VLLRVYNLLQTQWLYRQMQAQNRNLMEQIRTSQLELDAARNALSRGDT